MEIWIYRVTALIGATLGTLALFGAFEQPAPALSDAEVKGAAWLILGASLLLGTFSIRREWLPLLDVLMRWVAFAGGLVIFGGGLVYSLTMKDEQGAAIALIFGVVWFWNLMQKPSDNALPAIGRAIFLICCIVAGFFTALLLITIVERGNPLPGVQFALIAAGFFAVGWVMRFVLART